MKSAFLSLALLLASVSLAKEKGYRFSTDVGLVSVPVFVANDDGQPIQGLTAQDFQLRDDGKLRRLDIFQEVPHGEVSAAMAQAPALRRQFLLLFDLTFSKPRGLVRARAAALQLVRERLQPDDLVAVATYSNIAGLRLLVNFSTDRTQALRAIDGLGVSTSTDIIQDPVGYAFDNVLLLGNTEGFAPRETTALENELRALFDRTRASDENSYRNQAALFVAQLQELAESLGALSGRKFVLLFSEGIDDRLFTGDALAEADSDLQKFIGGRLEDIKTDSRFGRTELRDGLIKGLKRAAGMDVVVHTLDLSGLGTKALDSNWRSRETGSISAGAGRGEGRGQDFLYLVANETGGRLYKNLNDLSDAFEDLLSLSRVNYLMGFRADNLEPGGRYRKIDIEVKRADAHVRARRGYFEPKAAAKLTPQERKLRIAEYVAKDLVSDDLQLSTLIGVYPGRESLARVPVFLEVPGRQFLEDKRSSNVLAVEICGYAIDSEGRFVDFFNKTLSFDLPKHRRQFQTAGFKYYDLLLARPGTTRIKLIARDLETGKVGSVIEDIDVPDFTRGELYVSTPVFVMAEPDWVVARGFDPVDPEPRRKDLPVAYPFRLDGNDFVPAVRPTIRRGEPGTVVVCVYHLKPHPETDQPQTEMKFERVAETGDSVSIKKVGLARQPTKLAPGCYELVLQVQWADVPSGPALFEMSITDMITKKGARSRTEFTLAETSR